MATTRAWTFMARGRPQDVLRLDKSYSVPSVPPPTPLPKGTTPTEEWIHIKVAYAALNPSGLLHISMLPAFARAKTAVPENDLSGTVVDVWGPKGSSTASRFQKGDNVIAFLPVKYTFPTGIGALQGHVRIPARYAVRKPESASLRDAAGLMLAGSTASQLIEAAKVKKGHRVLVNGASGGVGTFAVQLAREVVGPEGFVVGVCSGRNVDMVKSIGADEVVDYTSQNLTSTELAKRYGPQPFDAVLDCIGVQDLYLNSAQYLKKGGIYAATGIKPPAMTYGGFTKAVWKMQMNAIWPLSPWLLGTGREWKSVTTLDPGLNLMEKLAGLLGKEKIKTVIDSVWPFEEVPKAYEVMVSGRARGKVLVQVEDELD